MKIFRQRIAKALAPLVEMDAPAVFEMLSRPPKAEMGDLALPCFPFAKIKRTAPPKIASELANQLSDVKIEGVSESFGLGPYLNFRLNPSDVARAALEVGLAIEAGTLVESPPDPETGEAPILTIDYSSPNIAKEFSVAHLRSTALGHSLVEIHKALGWTTVGINHLGDWGTQFGLLINAFREKGDAEKLAAEPIKHLQTLYVDISQRAKEDDSIQEAARATFRALEEGDASTVELWEQFRSLSLDEFDRIYDLLGVSFDKYEGEAFYNDKVEPMFNRLNNAGLAKEDQGAWIVPMDDESAPILLKKSDGASTYATRDLAAIAYRDQTYKFAQNLYCVDARQGQHFKQVFDTYAKLGEHEKLMASRCRHLPFGTVTVDGMAMSTREGNVILLEDYIREMADRAAVIVADKNDSLSKEEIENLAMDVAIGALVFEMLRREQTHNVAFQRDESLKFEGETGPRLQYLYAARLSSLLRTYPQKMGNLAKPIASMKDAVAMFDPEVFQTSADKELAKRVLLYPETVERAAAECGPNVIITWLLDLTDTFNVFYREQQVINPDEAEATHARIAFIRLLREVVAHALSLLGIPAPARI